MEESIKYFVPEISDIRVGYECEICPNMGYENTWIPMIGRCEQNSAKDCNLDELTYDCLVDGHIGIRVPYLTKEQIEGEGFELKHKSIDYWFQAGIDKASGIQDQYRYKAYRLFLNYGFHDQILKIKADFDGSGDFDKAETLYDGICKDINTFRYICKLLNIK